MKAYKVTGDTIAQSINGPEEIEAPFYIANDDGMIVVISEDLKTVLCEANIIIHSEDDGFYDIIGMETELEYQEENAYTHNIVEIKVAEDGRYEIARVI